MVTSDKSGEVKHIACEICMKEVPLSEEKNFETTDYFVHFCGIECYEKWKNQGENPKDEVEKPGS